MAKNMIFSVFLTIFLFFNRLLRAKFALLRQRTRNNFIQALMARDSDTIRATPRYRPYKEIHLILDSAGRTSAWWGNFVNEVVVRE